MCEPKSNSYQSLCCEHFYPLIYCHNRWMSCEEKNAYRAANNIPRTIDEWITTKGKMHTEAPTANPHKHLASCKYLMQHDTVECILNVIPKEVSL